MQDMHRTVAALSTPYGRGAIAMIRVTGEDTFDIVSRVFAPKNKKRLSDIPARSAIYGDFLYEGNVIDDGIVTLYKAPASYTGEDMAELCCHGGVLVSRLLLDSLTEAGAAVAEAGEFSRRAFVRGKLSLSRAEAVMDIIDAGSISSLRLAGGAGKGLLTEKIDKMYSSLKYLLASAYAYIDYPDEDMTDVSDAEMMERIKELIGECDELIRSYKTASAVCEGVNTVILGKPNVGKSSLLNMLVSDEAAIVTDIAGTTRDVITRTVTCREVLLKLSDTAGIRSAADEVERIGIERAIGCASDAALILAVFDGSRAPDEDDMRLISLLDGVDAVKIAVINKEDKGCDHSFEYGSKFTHSVSISAKHGTGKDGLFDLIRDLFIEGSIDYDAPHVTNARQYGDLLEARSALEAAYSALSSKMTADIAAMDLEGALAALAELDGREVTEDIVSEIFSKFCVGK